MHSDNLEAKENIPPIFTPGDEPYLGRTLLHSFDELICSVLETNREFALESHKGYRTGLQRAGSVLIPQAISLSLSIRELIRQGYLFGAKVLVRPFVERAVTLMYLSECEESLPVWEKGWNHRERPSLAKMLEFFIKRSPYPPEMGRQITAQLNSLIHGDPNSVFWNTLMSEDGKPVHPVSKNLHDPGLCDEICADVLVWLAVVLGIACKLFSKSEAKTT